MVATLRAGLSVLMLLGFYVLVLALVGALGFAAVWDWREHGGPGAAKLSWIVLVLAVAVIGALWKVARAKPDVPSGVPIAESQAPQLWYVVRKLAAEGQTRAPDEILVIAEVNAAVTEDTRLLGLIGGRRRLYLGLPLLQGLTVSQLQSALAHELGHYSGRHTRLGAIAYRGRMAIVATIEEIGPETLLGRLFRGYARLYVLVDSAVSRRQELEADQASVRTSGRSVAQSTLRELPVLGAAWSFYFGRYIAPGWEMGYAPRDFFGGFGELLRARQDELVRLRRNLEPQKPSKWDTHPPTDIRVRVMAGMGEVVVPVDNRPAHELLPMFGNLEAALAQKSVKYGDRRVVGWDELAAVVAAAQQQREADAVYRAAARLVRTHGADLSTVLGIVEAGRLGELAEAFYPKATRREAAQQFAELLELLLGLAAVASGVGFWRHSWVRSADLVRADGTELDLSGVAALATSAPTLPEARRQLAAMRIDVARATQVHQTVTTHDAELVGALSDIAVDDVAHDVLVLTNGLILRPLNEEERKQISRTRLREWIASGRIDELVQRSWFLPFEEVTTAAVSKRIPLRFELTLYDGRRIALIQPWSGSELPKSSPENLLKLLEPYIKPTVDKR